jgi:hypothetical protein
MEEMQGRVLVLAGIIANSNRKVIARARAVADLGVEAVQVTPTYYVFQTSEESLLGHFKEIWETVGILIVLYNVVRTNMLTGPCCLGPAVVERPDRRPDHQAQTRQATDVRQSKDRSPSGKIDRRDLSGGEYHRDCVRAVIGRENRPSGGHYCKRIYSAERQNQRQVAPGTQPTPCPGRDHSRARHPLHAEREKMEIPVRKLLTGAAVERAVAKGAMKDPEVIIWYVDFAARRLDNQTE